MTSRTSYLGRLIGLYCVLIGLVMFLRREAFVIAIGSLLGNPGAMLSFGVITLCVGLALVLAHNVWSGGALPILVTLVGWISLLKGLMIVILPPQTELDLFFRELRYQDFFYIYAAVVLCFGLYMTYAAFKSPSRT